MIRRHRLVELFLHRVLGLDWSEVDAEAEALEHALSPRLEQAIAAHLGEPVEDPHGHPIPTADGELTQRALVPLTTLHAGDRVVLREVQDDRPDRLRRWQELGLVPGAAVRIVAHQPLDGLYEVEVAGRTHRLAPTPSTGCWVRSAPLARSASEGVALPSLALRANGVGPSDFPTSYSLPVLFRHPRR